MGRSTNACGCLQPEPLPEHGGAGCSDDVGGVTTSMAVSNPNPVADLGPSEPGSGRHGPSADGPSDHARQAYLRVADPGSEPGSSSADVGDCPTLRIPFGAPFAPRGEGTLV